MRSSAPCWADKRQPHKEVDLRLEHPTLRPTGSPRTPAQPEGLPGRLHWSYHVQTQKSKERDYLWVYFRATDNVSPMLVASLCPCFQHRTAKHCSRPILVASDMLLDSLAARRDRRSPTRAYIGRESPISYKAARHRPMSLRTCMTWLCQLPSILTSGKYTAEYPMPFTFSYRLLCAQSKF